MMRHHFMYYPYHWIIMGIGLILLILAIVYLVRWYSGRERMDDDKEKTPLDIIKERYARGEIDREDFERMKRDLE